ncbi:hypothetical protein A3850_018675 [Lewinella sp. 4G2]|nr:hypothetical protein A3850_018675 [Lewinella sp. 4G2]
MTVTEKLAALRRAMLEHQIDAYVVPSTDPHQSEYPAPRWAGREWLSGFTGSAGTLVVTLHESKLWTDGRYFAQADTELADVETELMKDRVAGTPSIEDWLGSTLMSGQNVGADGRVISATTARRMAKKLADNDLNLILEEDLLRGIWSDRPEVPNQPVFEHEADLAGESWQDRLERMMAWQGEQGLDYYVISALDEVAWLLNIRGSDIEFNPLCVAYLVVGTQGDHALFAAPRPEFREWTEKAPDGQSIQTHDYKKISSFLRRVNASNADIGFDPATLSSRLATYAGGDECSQIASPIPGWKAIKNEVALGHLRQTMKHDAVALLRLFHWLKTSDEEIYEADVARKLTALRAEQPGYVTDSFPAIVGYAGNGAIIHYRAPEEGSAKLEKKGLLLLDSGGQYTSGTTDITRTIPMGEVTDEMRENYTRVLMGHIDLAMARFPVGTTGVQLDTLARMPLWSACLNYGHGTGHGVGYFLNVHEGPMGIHSRVNAANGRVPLAAGMVLSNEPGFYKEGEYGIRIENLVAVRPVEGQDGWLEFEDLTVFPINRSLVKEDMLALPQVQWLDQYNQWVATEMKELLSAEENAFLLEMIGG